MQNPYAVVVTCADSRVAPELIFDAGMGFLFVIRSQPISAHVPLHSTIIIWVGAGWRAM